MKNHNTTFLIIIDIGLLVALISFIAGPEYESSRQTNWTTVGFTITHVGGLFMLIANGTFILTKCFSDTECL